MKPTYRMQIVKTDSDVNVLLDIAVPDGCEPVPHSIIPPPHGALIFWLVSKTDTPTRDDSTPGWRESMQAGRYDHMSGARIESRYPLCPVGTNRAGWRAWTAEMLRRGQGPRLYDTAREAAEFALGIEPATEKK